VFVAILGPGNLSAWSLNLLGNYADADPRIMCVRTLVLHIVHRGPAAVVEGASMFNCCTGL